MPTLVAHSDRIFLGGVFFCLFFERGCVEEEAVKSRHARAAADAQSSSAHEQHQNTNTHLAGEHDGEVLLLRVVQVEALLECVHGVLLLGGRLLLLGGGGGD